MSKVPQQWQWLEKEPGPKVILEALKHYGELEHKGYGSNPNITKWAEEIRGGKIFTDDDIPWCGLFVAKVVKDAGFMYVSSPLWARNWLTFGTKVDVPMLGDVLVYQRKGGGGHVNFYVGETEDAYAGIGGNQSNGVNITFILKDRLLGARRCPWKVEQPANVRRIHLLKSGEISVNEQ